MKYIYVASPYTKGNAVLNVRESILAAERLVHLGFTPMAPLLQHLWDFVCPHPAEYWLAIDLSWLERCDAILRLPGESIGADMEEAKMRELGKPVFYNIGELLRAAYPADYAWDAP